MFQNKNCFAPPNFVQRCPIHLVMLSGDQSLNDRILLLLTSSSSLLTLIYFSFLTLKLCSKLWVECLKKMATSGRNKKLKKIKNKKLPSSFQRGGIFFFFFCCFKIQMLKLGIQSFQTLEIDPYVNLNKCLDLFELVSC